MRLKTGVSLVLVVVLSAGLAMAGRGGGSRGGGGISRPAPSHTPSFSAPRQNVSVSRPSFNTPRPAATPTFRPSAPQNVAANRPAITPGSRPGIGARPGIANTPNWDNRLSAGNRPSIDNRANIGNQRYVANRTNIGNNVNINNRTNNLVRPTHNDWNHGDWHHGDWHGNWNQSWYYRPVGWWTAGYWAGAAVSAIPWSWGYWPYYNPYYGGAYVAGSGFDYSQPIVVAQPVAAPPITQPGLTAEQQATPLLDAARHAFMQGDYKTALAQVDQAIAQVPNDTVLHEFRGLVLFALGRYTEAAAADYAVLSAGPGWDWTTLSGLYPNVDVYTEQLRALEQYAKSRPAASEARFLLADHYLTCGYTDAAAAQLKEVVRLNPKDQLSAQLLTSISAPEIAERAAPSRPAAATKPADASSLAGNWTATRVDGATIKLALAGDGKFTWALEQNGKPQQFSGTYTVADNLLVLKQGDNPMMVGQVASPVNDRFNFKLAGDNPSDPGLTFVR
ncbi:MAG: tetratricopeptide repeat protein [Thermoguttaceae bacterium]|jgi:tetratricopeptide (TPR) repeat protein